MKKELFQFQFEVYHSIDDLSQEDASLLKKARATTSEAYAPYSNFRVGAIAKLINGKTITGANHENASFPVGLCAERVVLASAFSQYPGVPIDTIAISYQPSNGRGDHPIAPCGICRQSLQELEEKTGNPIRLILGGMQGSIYIIPKAGMLLPLAFTQQEFK